MTAYLTLHTTDLTFTGSSDRLAKNIAALRLAQTLATEQRSATRAEQVTLAHYTAFGDSDLLRRLFPYNHATERYEVAEAYADLLSEADGQHLRRAALTAYYTPLDLIQVLWQAVDQLGLATLDQPRILEPAAGVGHMISMMPPALRERAAITLVELDPVTSRILPSLHPDCTIHGGVGFETVDLPPGGFDLVITNVPFGDLPVHDPTIDAPLRRTIHDYFLAKALRLLRPGGLLVALTSWGTLDKQTRTVRAWLAQQADLLGAWRLPNGLFTPISGTTSATDLLILHKRDQPPTSTPDWVDLTPAPYPRTTGPRSGLTTGSCVARAREGIDLATHPVLINRSWVDDPTRVLGTPELVLTPGRLWLQVQPPTDTTPATVLAERLRTQLPTHVVIPVVPPAADAMDLRMTPTPPPALDLTGLDTPRRRRAAALAAIYHGGKALIQAELQGDPAMETQRQDLNDVYDAFVRRYGIISTSYHAQLFRKVPELAFLRALEDDPYRDGDGTWRATKAPIFTRPTVRPTQIPQPGSCTPLEGLLWCLRQRGQVHRPTLARLCGSPSDQVIEQLGERLFRVPGTDRWEVADAYLCGDVRAKLRDAQAWAAQDASYDRNVQALTAVLPPPLAPHEITVNLHAAWLPSAVMTAFVQHLLPAWRGQATYDAAGYAWHLDDPRDGGATSVEATSTWGTGRAHAIRILRASLKGVPIQVYDLAAQDQRVLNLDATLAAQDKQQAITQAFTTWLWADADRTAQVCAIYNDRFNNVRVRSYDGSHLTLPGMATHVLRQGDLDPHQKSAVWQILQNATALIAFAVGGGKTFTALAAMVEAKRMGLVRTGMAVVPNHLVQQWASEAQRLYPASRILALGPEDCTRARRGLVLSRIATGQWDIVIIPHTSFGSLPLGQDTVTAFAEQDLDRLRGYLEGLRMHPRGAAQSIKQIEKAIAKRETQLQRMLAAIARDSRRTITWEELGIDLIVVDEAHAFKNLGIATAMTAIAGLPTASSQRALDLRMKTWELLQRNGKVVFLTATPVMNTLGEAFIMQRFLQESELLARGIDQFDAWVSLFAQPTSAFELKPDASGFQLKTRLNRFVNLPELTAMWRQVLHVKTKAQLGLPEPTLITGAPMPVVVPATRALDAYVQQLATRVDRIRARAVDPWVDNMLKITSDGRQAALDLRLVLPGTHRPHQSKIMALVAHVCAIYHMTDAWRGTQLVFCDLSTPTGSTAEVTDATDGADASVQIQEEHGANFVYHEIRQELVRQGLPAETVAFIHEATSKTKRAALFAAVNAGRVRVLLGSTAKMGCGMNVQERLIAIHHLDCPWRPGDLAQRQGRILRQGNMWPEVYEFVYVTERSFDAYLWQLIESKARFISQALAGEVTIRTIDDTDATVLSAAEIKAQATDNPRIIRKVQLEQAVSRLTRLRQVHHETVRRLRQDQQYTTQALHERRQRVMVWTTAQDLIAAHPSAPFRAWVATRLGQDAPTQSYDQRTAAGQALRDRVAQAVTAAQFQAAPVYQTIAIYRGCHLTLMAEPRGAATVRLTLPDGACLDTVTVQSDVGVWASCDKLLQSVEDRHQQAQDAVQESELRLDALARELERSTIWSGQTAYDAAQAELAELDAALTQATDTAETETASARPTATELELRTWLSLDALPADAPLPAITLPPITRWPDQCPAGVEVSEPVETVAAAGPMEETTDPVAPELDQPTPTRTRPQPTNQPDWDACARPTRPRRKASAVPEGQHTFLDLIA
ncbi:MAG: DEAD/DEAH box helicase family protein [Blastochloris sp.]|nr:DEAD/DEAH box helicase family protein [Blastochloris sp.]